jgi:hypothetical protein
VRRGSRGFGGVATRAICRYLCEEHLKLPKKKQDEALAKAAEKNG